MRAGEHKVARAYILYRDARAQQREAERGSQPPRPAAPRIATAGGALVPLDVARLERVVREACTDFTGVAAEPILEETLRSVFDGVAQSEVATALIMSARPLIERDPAYSYVTARLLLDVLRRDAAAELEVALGPAFQRHPDLEVDLRCDVALDGTELLVALSHHSAG